MCYFSYDYMTILVVLVADGGSMRERQSARTINCRRSCTVVMLMTMKRWF